MKIDKFCTDNQFVSAETCLSALPNQQKFRGSAETCLSAVCTATINEVNRSFHGSEETCLSALPEVRSHTEEAGRGREEHPVQCSSLMALLAYNFLIFFSSYDFDFVHPFPVIRLQRLAP